MGMVGEVRGRGEEPTQQAAGSICHARSHTGDGLFERLADSVAAAIAEELMGYFVPAAEHLRNDTGLPITSAAYGKG